MFVGVIHNPNANKNRKEYEKGKNPADALRKILNGRGILIETKDPKENPESLELAVEDCMKSHTDVICSDGGDGTAHYILTKSIEIYSKKGKKLPIFVPLMSGTVNFAAKGLGVNGKPVDVLERIVDSNDIKTKNVNVLKINHNGKAMYGLVYGMGAISNFLAKYYNKNISAFLSYDTSIRKAGGLIAKVILSYFLGTKLSEEILRPVSAHIKIDEYFCSRHTAVVASTIPINIIGLKPFHAIMNERSGIYILCGNFSNAVIFGNIHNAFLGKKINGEGVYLNKVGSIEMMVYEDDCNLTVDGELYKLQKGAALNLTVGPSIRVPEF